MLSASDRSKTYKVLLNNFIVMKKTFIVALVVAPALAFAQNSTGDLTGLVGLLGGIVKLLVPIVSTLAILFFFWGLAKYILNSGDEDKRAEGKDIMIWGILALFVMVTIWGILGFMQKTLGNNSGATAVPISFPTVTGNTPSV